MKLLKKDKIFILVGTLIMILATIFVFTGARVSGPETAYHEFSIPVIYEEYGERKTKTVNYCCMYGEEDKLFYGYYEDSGMPDTVNLIDGDNENGLVLWLELSLEPGYLMGDSAYADFYANGMPEPSMGYVDADWNEYSGVTEVETFGIKLIGCEYPEPIENKMVDKGVKLNHGTIGVLTVCAFVILVLGMILVKKEEYVVYQERDKVAKILNCLVIIIALPLLYALGYGWEILEGQSIDSLLAALMAPITVLGICASVILRRKGKSWQGMVSQFAGPLLFLYLIFANILLGFGAYLLFFVAGVVLGIFLIVGARKSEAAVPTILDRISLVTNILLIPIYFILSFLMLLMAEITDVNSGAGMVQEILARIFSFLIAATPIYCGMALGLSVSLRKKGKSLPGFLIQFVGFIGLLLLFLIDMVPWISMTIN